MTLLLKTKALRASLDDVRAVPTPDSNSTWKPIAHGDYLDIITEVCADYGITVEGGDYGLGRGGKRMFAVLRARADSLHVDGYNFLIGVRNSHDKVYGAGLVLGTQVVVCSNGVLAGASREVRKHVHSTDMKTVVANTITSFQRPYRQLHQRLQEMKEEYLEPGQAERLLFQAYEQDILTTNQLGPIYKEYLNPTYDEFRAPTSYNLMMAVTQRAKEMEFIPYTKVVESLDRMFNLTTY